MKKYIYILFVILTIVGSLYIKRDMKYGCVSGNCSSGKGTFYYFSGDTYSGEWMGGRFHGDGTYFWAKSNDKYTGSWIDGKREGQGTMFFDTGQIMRGEWRNDKYLFFDIK